MVAHVLDLGWTETPSFPVELLQYVRGVGKIGPFQLAEEVLLAEIRVQGIVVHDLLKDMNQMAAL